MHVSLAPEALFQIGPLTVTNSMLTAALTTVLIIGALLAAVKRLQLQPASGFAGMFEATCDAALEQCEAVFGSYQAALTYFPLITGLFLFILINNWIALMPGFNTLLLGDVPVFRSVSADLNTTISLALISVVLTQAYGIKRLGLVGNLKRYISKNPMMTATGILEFFLELTRVISFSFRLFGNIFAGEVLLIVISALVPLIGPAPFWGMELFVGAIQAMVFAMLTMVFIGIAVTPVEHGH